MSARSSVMSEQSDAESMSNIKTEIDEEAAIPEFSVEIVKTTHLFAPDKANKMSSTKTVMVKDGKSEAEAKAIYGTASGLKVATKEELK